MPSDLHQALVALFRDRPTLAPELLQTALGVSVPPYQRVRVVEAKLGLLKPIQFDADLVLELEAKHTVLSVILEVQLDYKRDKKFSWPSYVTNLEARTQQPACLLVVAPDDGLAAWCRQPIEFGLGSGVFTPRVLGPSAVPVVTDRAAARQAPELAVLSALAHGNAPHGDRVITAMLGGVGALDEARRDFYLNLVATQLNAVVRATDASPSSSPTATRMPTPITPSTPSPEASSTQATPSSTDTPTQTADSPTPTSTPSTPSTPSAEGWGDAGKENLDLDASDNLDVMGTNSLAGSIGHVSRPLTNGYTTSGCSIGEVARINEAMGILLETIGSSFERFKSCIDEAPLVELNCSAGQSRQHIAQSLGHVPVVTRITCYSGRDKADAEAYVGISGNELWLDHGFISSNSGRAVASVIAHEIMHNRGYRHSLNDFGSRYYRNTVPEQVRACILNNGTSNPSQGPETQNFDDHCNEGWAEEVGASIRQGMHACSVGMYMTGVHTAENRFLCKRFPNNTYASHQEFVDRTTKLLGMHNCPTGFAMTGLHVGDNLLLCAPFTSDGERSIDYNTSRQGMHACKVGGVMTGIHSGNNYLTCQQ